jgi:hypothetical protein
MCDCVEQSATQSRLRADPASPGLVALITL